MYEFSWKSYEELINEEINNIKEFLSMVKGIDILKYKKRLLDIELKYKNVDVECSKIYDKYMCDLRDLVKDLQDYHNYQKIKKIISNEFIENILSNNITLETTISRESLKRVCLDLISALNKYKESSNVNYDVKVIDKALEPIYIYIKEDIKYNVESDILDKMIGDSLYYERLNNLVYLEIEELKKSTYLRNPEFLKGLEREIKKSKNNLFSEKILILLIACKDKEIMQKSLIKYFKNSYKILSEKNDILDLILVSNNSEKLKKILNNRKKVKNKILIKVFALVSSITVLCGVMTNIIKNTNESEFSQIIETKDYDESEFEVVKKELYLIFLCALIVPTSLMPIELLIKMFKDLENKDQFSKEFKNKLEDIKEEIKKCKSIMLEQEDLSELYYYLLENNIIEVNYFKLEELIDIIDSKKFKVNEHILKSSTLLRTYQ